MSFAKEPNAEPIKGYRLIEPLGSGGFGEVWKCEAPGGLLKAIKFVYGNLDSLDIDSQRAEQELQALRLVKEVRHPFVLSMERLEVVAGEVVLVMELADKSLHDFFVECQSAGLVGIPRDALLRYVRDAAEALDHMNEKHGLQHLDVKPRNLFLISDRVKVADFGLVKHLEREKSTGLMGGVTPLYAPPETFNGTVTSFSDQYSLAIVYQELLTGQRPFTGKNVRQLAQQHVHGEPELRPLPEGERPVVARALSKDPEKRFPNCLAFIRALYQAQGRIRPDSLTDSTLLTPGMRPKTMAETLEDIQLEQIDEIPEKTPASAQDEADRLGMTVPQPQHGALRPTLVIGLGSFGRQALLEMRCRFLDRFGDLKKIPMVRFLYADPDPESIRKAQTGTNDVPLSRTEAQHLPLLPVGQYRKRMLDSLLEWLPREKLYAMPRSLQTQGSRALGRLAFVDNHLRFQARLRKDLQQAMHADTLYQTVSQTGLALRDAIPRIYVIAAAGGGASGCLLDLSYTLRHVLQQLRQPDAEISLYLFCGTPGDAAASRQELANIYATITELNHFNDPSVGFTAEYGADGPRLTDQGAPYSCVYLLQSAQRTPEALRCAVSHLGSYLFHELTTPLGLRLEQNRRHVPNRTDVTCFRSFGTAAIWFPRGLLLRTAARQACQRLLGIWHSQGEPTAGAEIEAACARAQTDSELRPENVAARLEDGAAPFLEGKPAEALTALLATLEEQSQQPVAQDDAGNWARQALTRIREWTGISTHAVTGVQTSPGLSEWQRSRLSRALRSSAEKLAEHWDKKLSHTAFGLMEFPGRRVAAAEVALGHLVRFAEETAAAWNARVLQQIPLQQQAWKQLETALEGCLAGGGGFTFFGSRNRRNLRLFMDRLTVFARQRLAEESLTAGHQLFVLLRTRLLDRIRDLGLIRQRLRHLQEKTLIQHPEAQDPQAAVVESNDVMSSSPFHAATSFWDAVRGSAATTRVILPDGAADLEKAASKFLTTLNSDHWTQLDQFLQDRVLVHRGGLHEACMKSVDMAKFLALPLVTQAATQLGEHLPITDVAQIELATTQARQTDMGRQIKIYYSTATPLVQSEHPEETAYLLIPASDSGKTFGEVATRTLPNIQLVRVPGQAHLMFCREQGYLSIDDLHHFLQPCRSAYERSTIVPHSSPHARFDIVDWLPLDP